MHKQKGFTIVELLIVIVVIAILASISVVAYNGIQLRARNTQQVSVAQSYVKAFAAYLATYGSYPSTAVESYDRICLAIDQVACTSNTYWNRDTILENDLKKIVSNLPVANASTPVRDSPKMAYVPASDITLNGVANPFLIFTIEPPGNCTLSGLVSGSWPTFNSTVPSQGYTLFNDGMRVCIIALPRSS